MSRTLRLQLGAFLMVALSVGACRTRSGSDDPSIPPIPENPLYGPVVTQAHLPPVLQGYTFGLTTKDDVAGRFVQENLLVSDTDTVVYGGDREQRWQGRHPNQGFPYNELVVTRRVIDSAPVGAFYADLGLVSLRFTRNEGGRGPVLVEAEIAQPVSATPSVCDPARALVDAPGALDSCPNRFPYSPHVDDDGYTLCVGSPDGRQRMMIRCVEPRSSDGTRRIFYTMAVPMAFQEPAAEQP